MRQKRNIQIARLVNDAEMALAENPNDFITGNTWRLDRLHLGFDWRQRIVRFAQPFILRATFTFS